MRPTRGTGTFQERRKEKIPRGKGSGEPRASVARGQARQGPFSMTPTHLGSWPVAESGMWEGTWGRGRGRGRVFTREPTADIGMTSPEYAGTAWCQARGSGFPVATPTCPTKAGRSLACLTGVAFFFSSETALSLVFIFIWSCAARAVVFCGGKPAVLWGSVGKRPGKRSALAPFSC